MPKLRDTRILRRLQYFEATARLGSVAAAAKELGVSSSAVSHQLADLRRTLGEDLFRKSGRGVALTNAGTLLAQRLSTAFNILESSVTSTIGEERPVLRIAACSAFGPYWLMPRLHSFRDVRPEIETEVRLYARDPELTQAAADCIVTAQAVTPGYVHVDLFEEMVIPVVRPDLVRNGKELPLITTDTKDAELGNDWRAYLAESRKPFTSADRDTWIRCSHYILALEAAKAGYGAALIPDFVAASAISDGHLVRLDEGRRRVGRTYRACYKEACSGEPALIALVSWLRRTAQNGRASGANGGGR